MSCGPELPAPRPARPGPTLRVWPDRRPGLPLAAARLGRRALQLLGAAAGRLRPRLRPAAAAALPALLILAVVAAGFAALATRQLRRDFTQQLTIAADDIGIRVVVHLDRAGRYTVVAPELDRVAAADHAVVRIMGGDRLVPLGTTLDAPPLGPPSSTPVDRGAYRVVSRPGHANIGQVYVEYARPVAALDATIGQIKLYLVLGVLAGTILAGAAGARIARRSGR